MRTAAPPFIMNDLATSPVSCRTIELTEDEGGKLTNLFGSKLDELNVGEAQVFELNGYGYRWFRRWLPPYFS
jgi:hypothetical protein